MAHDVFISYSTKDKTIADAVCAKLEENSIRVWISPRDVPAGSNFAESIVEAINTCKVFVLIWSANTNTSKHILNEINQAFDQGIIIIPFRIQDVQPTSAMRYYIGNTHWLDAIDPPLENHIASLKDIILVNLGREPHPSAATPPLEESPGEVVKPPDEPSVEKEPVIEKSGAVKPPVKTSRQKKSRKIDQEIQPSGAATANITRFIPFAVGGLVVLTLVVLLFSGVFKGSPLAEIIQPSLSPTAIIKPPETVTPIPAWVEEFSEPILAAIKDSAPDFEDDFSQVNTNWNYIKADPGEEMECFNTDDVKMNITDGSMKFSIANCRVGILYYPEMQYANYVLQLDANFQQTPLGLEFRMWSESPSEQGTLLGFHLRSPEGDWAFQILDYEDIVEYIEGVERLDFSKPVRFTIINKSPTFLVYLNSSLLFSFNTQEEYAGPFFLDFTVNSWEFTPTETLTLELDNVKIWDLDQIEIPEMSPIP